MSGFKAQAVGRALKSELARTLTNFKDVLSCASRDEPWLTEDKVKLLKVSLSIKKFFKYLDRFVK